MSKKKEPKEPKVCKRCGKRLTQIKRHETSCARVTPAQREAKELKATKLALAFQIVALAWGDDADVRRLVRRKSKAALELLLRQWTWVTQETRKCTVVDVAR